MAPHSEYQQLVATGLWRGAPEAQRREVTVTIGEETLILSDDQARALTHWSLTAFVRANPGVFPAVFHPDGDPGETLELDESEGEMIRALDRLRSAIDRRRPHPGRLRLVLLVLMLGAVLLGGIFWLPDALRRHAVTVVPLAKRAEIGATLTLNPMDFEVGEYTISVQALDDANPPEYSNTLAASLTLKNPPPAAVPASSSGGGALHWLWLLAGLMLTPRLRRAQ